jgi:hypothetical protein
MNCRVFMLTRLAPADGVDLALQMVGAVGSSLSD